MEFYKTGNVVYQQLFKSLMYMLGVGDSSVV